MKNFLERLVRGLDAPASEKVKSEIRIGAVVALLASIAVFAAWASGWMGLNLMPPLFFSIFALLLVACLIIVYFNAK